MLKVFLRTTNILGTIRSGYTLEPMNPRYREIHRAEIKWQMHRSVDRRWDALYGAYLSSIILVGFGFEFCFIPRPGSCVIGFIFFSLGAIFFAMYRWLLRVLRRQDKNREWLNPRDQLIIATLICSAIFLSNDELTLIIVLLLTSAYGTWRLWLNSRPHWRRWYFRAGRDYFREIEGYTNKRRQE